MPLNRITVTIPAALVRGAGARARRERRSRSWIVAEALRHYLAEAPAEASPASPRAPTADEFTAESRRVAASHLTAALVLTPADRLARAEELGQLARERQGRSHREQVIAFETYDDYYRWKLARLIGA